MNEVRFGIVSSPQSPQETVPRSAITGHVCMLIEAAGSCLSPVGWLTRKGGRRCWARSSARPEADSRSVKPLGRDVPEADIDASLLRRVDHFRWCSWFAARHAFG